ncbi:reverse transcriptase [Leminorella grimontii]|uniref:RNA-directed DNA polymerase n=1 Tax=Leminorella grimontii TaxID=82981 RepID=A0AAV5N8R4_9GAMM|nr:reverse transcriptase family protein [Leminorella grimontii]KFC93945.1 msDNA specific RNA-directed DNA polymerase [Leminorella grimontii ATCC 33999 = DSM 5078]GKX57278.1 reverse transcriptase [Leminorella grimontii]VFS54726.1 Retron-type reverse transcriptase [Leminorella grimontii]
MDAARACLIALELTGKTACPADKEIQCLYALSNRSDRHYRKIVLTKRSGGLRTLYAPDILLKSVQRNILRNVLSLFPLSPFATAYREKCSTLDNASPHVAQSNVLKLDIENFFDSITFFHVHRLFKKTELPAAVVTLLTHLCCHRDVLPQGAPTSPTISNLVMKRFDDVIGLWCQERDIVYTRYCDDMTFSGDFDARQVKNKVRGLLYDMGFTLNARKSRLITANQRQTVTGIVVNQKPQLTRDIRRKLRQEVYFCQRFGVASHLVQTGDFNPQESPREQRLRYLQSLQGKIAYLLQINPDDAEFQNARSAVRQLLKEESASA